MPAITTDAVLFGLNDAKVSPLATDLTTAPTYGTAMDCPGVSTLSAQPIMENKENRGDGVILHTTSRMVGMDIEFKVAMLPLAMLPMIQGGTITSGGVTPAGKQTYSLKQTDAGPQYFKIEGVWDPGEVGIGDTHLSVFKVKCTEPPAVVVNDANGDYGDLTIKGRAVFTLSDKKLYEIVINETAIPLV